MNNSVKNDIFRAAHSVVYAIVLGGLLGIAGLGFSILPLNTAFIFGGVGLLLAYTLGTPILLPAIHCVYAFFIIRFHFRGIILVILIHYTLMIIGVSVWTLLNLPPDIWDGVKIFYAAYFDPAPVYVEPINKVLGPILVAMVVIPSAAYNGFLLSLLSARMRKMLSLS